MYIYSYFGLHVFHLAELSNLLSDSRESYNVALTFQIWKAIG